MNAPSINPTYFVGHVDGSYTAADPQPSPIRPEIFAALETCERVLSDLSSVTQEGSVVRQAWMQARAALREAA